jgi:magnesium-transporting ATPase (P-type)
VKTRCANHYFYRVGIIDAPENATYELCHIEKQGFKFVPLHSFGSAQTEEVSFSYTPHDMEKLGSLVKKGQAAVCMTGDILSKLAMTAIQHSHDSTPLRDNTALSHPAARKAIAEIVPIVSVFARHEPRHKEAVISAFNLIG